MSALTPEAVTWIKIVATLAVFIVLMILFFRQGRGKDAGSVRESVRSRLEKLGGEFMLLNDVIVAAERGMSRIDHVLVSPYGIFVITVKDIAGKITGRVGDREWDVKAGRKKERIYNPLWENRKHIHALQTRLGDLIFIPVVVMAGARLKSDLGSNVVSLSDLLGFIKRYINKVLSEDQQKEAARKLLREAPSA